MSSVSLRNRAALRPPQRLDPTFPRRAIHRSKSTHAKPTPMTPPLPIWDDRAAALFGQTVSADGATLTKPEFAPDAPWSAKAHGMWVVVSQTPFVQKLRYQFRIVVTSSCYYYVAVGLVSRSDLPKLITHDYGTDFSRCPMLLMKGAGVYEFDIHMQRRQCVVKHRRDGEEHVKIFDNLPRGGVYLACSLKHPGVARIEQ